MTPEDVDALAAAVDSLIGGEPAPPLDGTVSRALLQLASHLNESFPRITAEAARRARVRQRVLGPPVGAWRPAALALPAPLEAWAGRLPLTRRNLLGTAAFLTVCVLGYAYLRQRSAGHKLAAAHFAR